VLGFREIDKAGEVRLPRRALSIFTPSDEVSRASAMKGLWSRHPDSAGNNGKSGLREFRTQGDLE
jgi:hypothetical protein